MKTKEIDKPRKHTKQRKPKKPRVAKEKVKLTLLQVGNNKLVGGQIDDYNYWGKYTSLLHPVADMEIIFFPSIN